MIVLVGQERKYFVENGGQFRYAEFKGIINISVSLADFKM